MKALLLTLLVLGSACAVSVPDLGPFLAPADDAGCPDGLQRFRTLCAKPCAASSECPDGTTCTAADGGVCVVDCTANSQSCVDRCPEFTDDCASRMNQDCQPLALDARDGCLPGGVVVPDAGPKPTPDAGPKPVPDAGPGPNGCLKVQAVDGGGGCSGSSDVCVVPNGAGHNKCGNKDPCPLNSTCQGIGPIAGCVCNAGFTASSCAGVSCQGGKCADTWCKPNPVLSCTAPNPGSDTDCFCKSGAASHRLTCGAPQTCEQLCEQVQP